MKRLTQIRSRGLIIYIMTFCLLSLILSVSIHGQNQVPSDNYYNENIGGQPPSSFLPSQQYHNNLRAGEWDEDGGPGGSGEDGNQGVGVPLTGGVAPIIACVIIYGVYLYSKKRNRLIG